MESASDVERTISSEGLRYPAIQLCKEGGFFPAGGIQGVFGPETSLPACPTLGASTRHMREARRLRRPDFTAPHECALFALWVSRNNMPMRS